MNDLKFIINNSCRINEYYPNINSEYAVRLEAVVPVDTDLNWLHVFIIRDQMNIEFTFFNVIFLLPIIKY